MHILFFFLSAAFLTFLLAGILLTIFRGKIILNERVEMYFNETESRQTQSSLRTKKDSRVKRKFQSYWNQGTTFLNEKVSNEERKKLDLLLRDAGYPLKSAAEFRLFQFLLSALLSLPFLIFIMPLSENKLSTCLIFLTMAILGFRIPVFYLGKKKTERIKEINQNMPDFFDTVNLLLEAGMGLDLAFEEVSVKLKGALSDEFLQTLEDMKLGKSRRDAFYDLRKRIPSDSFQSIITSLIQADQLGIGMGKVLKNLTVRIREQRREAARAQAMKAPVKMLFPMVFFIFPSIFIVILGPLVIQLVTQGFGG